MILDLLNFIEACGKSGDHIEKFIVEVIKRDYKDIPPKIQKRAVELLEKVVERRHAIKELPDPVVRQASYIK
jgi:hypothetical protein